ncbi:fumarate reductase flavo protein subunit [Trichodelitschia bisporula]|uniref:Fumarate reductase flavo protein subunit n=1 Tax=Trichodelitschia bisporula TaxID=703511 RepID=A0A6G1HU17_9PEZI|nr:fumarate reductase flavo protein subunit [Trichodelitschia bisporula]
MPPSDPEVADVLVIGSGNAGFSAASSAAQHGARVILLEKAPAAWAGGNTTFTAGAYRTAFAGLSDVLPLVTNAPASIASRIDMAPYTPADFMADLRRVTDARTDPALALALVNESNETTKWLHALGVRFVLSFHRQAYEIANRFKFWGGMVLAVEDGGKGLVRMHQAAAKRLGVDVRYDTPVTGLVIENGAVVGVTLARPDGSTTTIRARGGVVLAAGGFEASPRLRAAYLGPGWDRAYVRGTPYNTGELLHAAMGEAGAASAGNWSGCHSTCWDAAADANTGDPGLTNQYTKSGYPLGVMVNAEGKRFVDEGEDMRNYTYAKFGRAVLGQAGGVAWQVWDAEGAGWLRKEEYAPDVVERVEAGSLEELADRMAEKGFAGKAAFLDGLAEYNAAVAAFRRENPNKKFDPSVKDGMSTRSSASGLTLGPDKTNWATPITKAPFLAVKITCGVTFTFGGLKTDAATAGVVSQVTGKTIPGLYVAGEMVGGLYYGNYPGGSGLTAGAVFGRKAGREAARRAGVRAAL